MRVTTILSFFVGLLLAAMQSGALDAGGSGGLDTVTCSLEEYRSLYKQAYLQEGRRELEQDRRRLEKERDLTRQAVEAERASEATASKERLQRRQVLPGNWRVLEHKTEGGYQLRGGPEERNMALFNFSIELRLFEDIWTTFPIIDAQMIVANLAVERASEGEWKPVRLGDDLLIVLQSSNISSMEDRVLAEAHSSQASRDLHTLVTNTSGKYRIQFQAYTLVRSNRKYQSLELNLWHPITQMQLRLFRDSDLPCRIIRDLSIEPFGKVDISEDGDCDGHKIQARLPSTRRVTLKWRAKTPDEVPSTTVGHQPSEANHSLDPAQPTNTDERDKQETPQATVAHDALHSVAEGILESTHTIKYSMDSEQSLNSVSITMYGQVRVTSVVAHGMQSWHAQAQTNMSVPGESDEVALPSTGTVVKVFFKSSLITREVILMIRTELEFDVENGKVELPQVVCEGVLRQTGTILVVKSAHVEVYEHSSRGLARTSVSEVPSHVRSRTSHPMVLAYRFHAARHALILSVLFHDSVQTLDAVVDTALYRALVVDTQSMHSLMLVFQNTQRQYMEIKGVPPAATLWGLKVNSIAAKPVRGDGGSLLVPLLVEVSGDSAGGSSTKGSVELAWLTEHDALGMNGTLSLNPPRLNMPITALSVEVRLPNEFEANFSGSLRRVMSFSNRQPAPVSRQSVMEGESNFPSSPASPSLEAQIPRRGKQYLFEKILVMDGSATLSASYALPPNKSVLKWSGLSGFVRSWF